VLFRSRGKWLLCYAAVPSLLAVIFVGFAEGGRRFAVVALPAFLLLAGEGLDFLISHSTHAGRKAAWAVVALVLLSLGLQDALYFTVERGQRPRWSEAAEYVLPKARSERADIMAAAPEVLGYYAHQMHFAEYASPYWFVGCITPPGTHFFYPYGISLDELRHPAAPVYVVVERVANVAPGNELAEFLSTHGTLEKTFPLRVRFLDYSLSVYRVPATPASGAR
jgi:hypothetical protein